MSNGVVTIKPGLLVLDCDGVILVSNRLKLDIFTAVAMRAGLAAADARLFRTHVAANFGRSRYKLFDDLISIVATAGKAPPDIADLLQDYATQLRERYVRCPTTPGALLFLRRIQALGIPMAVVSGSDQAELREMFERRGIADMFGTILGSPTSKIENLRALRAASGKKADDIVYVGDAEADMQACQATGVRFIYMRRYATAKNRMAELVRTYGIEWIDDLRDIDADRADAA